MIVDEINIEISLLKIVLEFYVSWKVTFVLVEDFSVCNLQKRTASEEYLLSVQYTSKGVGDRIDWLRSDPLHFRQLYGDLPYYSKEYIYNLFTPVPNVNTRRGRVNANHTSQYVNISNGMRHTVGQPAIYDNSIFIVGGSSVYGYGCEDQHTLASWLQRLLNASLDAESIYTVFNLGARGAPKFVDFYKLLQLKLVAGDIVVFQGLSKEILNALEHLRSKAFLIVYPTLSQRKEEIFFDSGHVTYKGMEIVAKDIYNALLANINTAILNTTKDFELSQTDRSKAMRYLEKFTTIFTDIHTYAHRYPELQEYLNGLKEIDIGYGINGAVVLNSNPFTLGHRYLLENAARKVAKLFVFVVEENLSYFDFETRMQLVRKGTFDLKNVVVLKSGKFIMSTFTCPEYFAKDQNQFAQVDASNDMDIFGEYIAPTLNIKVRFVGEEPLCSITRQHNIQMQNILPTYGIKVIQIKRKVYDNEVISASLVRKYFQAGELKKIEEIVPSTTFEHLLAMKNKS